MFMRGDSTAPLTPDYNSDMSSALTDSVRHSYVKMVADLTRVFGDRFVAFVVSPTGASAGFVSSLTADDLDALGTLADAWRRDFLQAPLVMTPDEFKRSLDAFPLEYQSLLDHHEVLAGTPPFDGVVIHADDLRRACEAQARGHLIHLRQGWIEQASHHGGLAELIADSSEPLRTVLRNLARLNGDEVDDDAALAAWAGRVAGLPDGLVRDVLALTDAAHRRDALVPRMREYLAACERLWAYTDAWRAR